VDGTYLHISDTLDYDLLSGGLDNEDRQQERQAQKDYT